MQWFLKNPFELKLKVWTPFTCWIRFCREKLQNQSFFSPPQPIIDLIEFCSDITLLIGQSKKINRESQMLIWISSGSSGYKDRESDRNTECDGSRLLQANKLEHSELKDLKTNRGWILIIGIMSERTLWSCLLHRIINILWHLSGQHAK